MKKSIKLMVAAIGCISLTTHIDASFFYLANKSSLDVTINPTGAQAASGDNKLPAKGFGTLTFAKEVSSVSLQKGYRLKRSGTKLERYIQLKGSSLRFGTIEGNTEYGESITLPQAQGDHYYVVIDISATTSSGPQSVGKAINVEVYPSYPAVKAKYPKSTIDTGKYS